MYVCALLFVCVTGMGFFRVTLHAQGLCFKARLSTKLLNNIEMIFMQINLIFTRKVLHLASF